MKSEEMCVPELTASNTFINHDDFIAQVQNFANFYNFQIRKDKVERDKNNNIKKKLYYVHAQVLLNKKKKKIIKEIIILKDEFTRLTI